MTEEERQAIIEKYSAIRTAAKKEKKKEINKRWRAKNREKDNASNLAWKRRNPEYTKAYSATWLRNNPELAKTLSAAWRLKNPTYARVTGLKRRYNISLEQWEIMFKEQDYKCKTCRSEHPKGRHWHTDHCHKTGRIRGILCADCNMLIGFLERWPAEQWPSLYTAITQYLYAVPPAPVSTFSDSPKIAASV